MRRPAHRQRWRQHCRKRSSQRQQCTLGDRLDEQGVSPDWKMWPMLLRRAQRCYEQAPKGVLPSQYADDSFTFTTPHSSLSAQRNAVFMSDVYTDAHRPRAQLFATAMASSTSRTTITGAMGPKVSSRFASESRLT